MIRLTEYMLQRRMLVNLIALLLMLAGIFCLVRINRESIPDVNFDMVSIVTVYPGASPAEAEDLISIPIEKKLRGVSGIQKVRSYNVENVSFLVIFLEDGIKDKRKAVQDIKDAVGQADNLPSNASKPLVKEITFENTELVSIAFTGKNAGVPYSRIRDLADRMEDIFYDIDGVAEVEKLGFYDREYLVEVDPGKLDEYRIGMNTLLATLKMRNIDFPGGALRIGKKEFVLRTKGQFRDVDEIRNTVITANDSGNATRIGDIATVRDSYKEADARFRFDGKEAVVFKLWKKRSADEIELSGRLRKTIGEKSPSGYDDIAISFFDDQSKMTERRLSAVIEEAVIGFTILGLFMLFLLGRRMSLIVLMGIPVTFMGTFIYMWYFGITLNIVSLFGVIMVLGMVVDFSIVIAENSHRYMEEGLERIEAVRKGLHEVFWPVTVTFVCIVIAFLPLLLVSGMIGKFVKAIPTVIIVSLAASWAFAMFMLPAWLNMLLRREQDSGKPGNSPTLPMRVAAFICALFGKKTGRAMSGPAVTADIRDEDAHFEAGGFGHVQRRYKMLVRTAVEHRYITLGILLALFSLSLYLIPVIGFKFIPKGGEEQIRINVKLPYEMNLEANHEEMKKLEKIVLELPGEELESLCVTVGVENVDIIDPKPSKATFKSTFNCYLTPEKTRRRTAGVINEGLRKNITAAQKAGILMTDMDVRTETVMKSPPVGRPVNVEIRGEDFETSKKIAAEYVSYLTTIEGVHDVAIDLEEGKTEYRYSANDTTAAWTGVSTYDIAMSIHASFAGAVPTKLNQKDEEIGIRVRFNEEARTKMKGLSDVKIANMTGGLVPLNAVSKVQVGKSYSQINRLNYHRLMQVQADADASILTPVEVTSLLEKKFPDIEKRYPGFTVRYGGEQEDTDKSMGELGALFVAALIVIFIILTVYMNSLLLPVVVMSAIPFALVGVVFALVTHQQPLSFMSTLGLFSLAGIIVSNTLILVQFINKFRQEGMSLKDAIIEGGVVRLRPIVLTAGSMVLELIPVIYGIGGKDYLVAPLALAFGYGLIFATFITLIIVPCFYHIAEDLTKSFRRLFTLFG
ncbi:MAG: efflux RND transporter permease subunit [Spirochaetes bacterium]|nr:MAG: efflux RND transporter permease subunit [Spirochaetota bacterium]